MTAPPAAPPVSEVAEPEGITLASLGVRYLDFAEGYYRTTNGGTTSSVDGIRMALDIGAAGEGAPAGPWQGASGI